ncbi:esterase-like activity of phytase family protein [Sporomusa sp.]|uniref:esterase-like activity of phytase family protein n=1 Tax=Sporomusa sp. TaxID=2078658 RepID=UPI002C5F2F98|nr:esterase-like activity of phytase family protein [Sporomusa sp.]HWR09344.1 esterase-like activity of phytase family protein [Sporomusa sp.]
MQKKIWAALVIAALTISNMAVSSAADTHIRISKYVVAVPTKFNVGYTGQNQQTFPNGFRTGFGSGLSFKSMNKDGSIELYGITDRGPNGDGPGYQTGDQNLSCKFFPSPDFQPEIGIIKLKDGQASVIKTIGLETKQGRQLTGLPVTPGLIGTTNEIALDENLANLGYDNNGLDPEGIAVDKQGNFWTCDEYGPFITQFDNKGKLLKKYSPGDGLPEILKYRVPNRGFEGITIAPNGSVYAIVQSPLALDETTGKTARFTRIVRLDPATGKTAMFAYPIDVAAYKAPKDAKVGDIYAISDTKLLVIEQGKGKDKNMRNLIYSIDLAQATDISGLKVEGKELEFIADPSKLAGIHFADKTLVFDLRAHGWNTEKAEGLTMLPDKKTIAVTNDNDFGIAIEVVDPKNPKAEITDYTLLQDGSFRYKNEPAQPQITIVANDEAERNQYIWMIELPEALR